MNLTFSCTFSPSFFATIGLLCAISVARTLMLGDHEIPQSDSFRYLGSIISKVGEIDGDVEHRIKVG